MYRAIMIPAGLCFVYLMCVIYIYIYIYIFFFGGGCILEQDVISNFSPSLRFFRPLYY